MEPLNEIEKHSPAWLKVKAHVEARLALLARANEKIGLDEAATNGHRGGIGELKKLLSQAEPKPKEP